MITANITVNLSGEPQLIRVPAKQGDVGSREVSIKFVDNGVIYSIPKGTTARIRVTKPDGKYVFNDCTIEGNAVIAPLTAQTLAAAGDAKVDIAMYQGENELLSCSVFILAIMPRAGSDSAIESTDEFGALVQALQQIQGIDNTYVKIQDYITNLEIDALDDDVSDIPDSENILLQLSEKIDTKADNMTLSSGFLQLTSDGDPIGSAIGLPEGGGGGTTIETIDSTEINDLFEEE